MSSERIAFYTKYLKTVAEHTSTQETKAQELEWKVKDYFIAMYYQDKIGKTFDGVISGMISKGIFVELADTAEGIILMERGNFDEEMLERRDGKQHYCLGQQISVQLVDIDPMLRRFEFKMYD